MTSYNTFINEDRGSSKVLNLLFEELQKTNQESSKLYDALLEAEEISSKYQIAIVAVNASSLLFDIIGFAKKWIGLLSIPSGIISNILSDIKDGYNTEIKLLRKSLNLTDYLYQTNPIESNIDKIKIIIDSLNAFIPVIRTNSIFWSKALSSISKKWSIFGSFYDLNSLIKSGFQLDKELKSLERTTALVANIKNIYEQNKNRWTEFQKLNKIVVISETRQIGSYSNGGTGGTNMFFKRLIDGKIFSRKEMLAMSKFELASYNFIKVKRTVIKNNKTYTYEYIRSKNSNKTLDDNLG